MTKRPQLIIPAVAAGVVLLALAVLYWASTAPRSSRRDLWVRPGATGAVRP